MAHAPSLRVFLGTYTPAGGDSRGVYTTQLDPATGRLDAPAFAAAAGNPTFLALHPRRDTLYALTEQGTVNGRAGGALAAFRVAAETGALTPLDVAATGGGPLAHVAVDATGRMAAVISYHASEVATFPLRADGAPGPRASLFTAAGSLGPQRHRQDKPHPHSLTFSPDNRFLYVCDLGRDRVYQFGFDPATAVLTLLGETATAAGAGPRHSRFSPDGRHFYVINELNGTITTYGVDAASGHLTAHGSVPTLPTGFTGENTCAEIRLSPDGRFVYGSNRGHDSIAVLSRDAHTGALAPVEIVPSGGRHPRNFNLTPDGRWLLAANRDTGNVVVFRVDPSTGRLTPAGHEIAVPQAVCVVFAPIA